MTFRRAVAVLAVLALVSIYPLPTRADPMFEVYRTFWSTCGPSRTVVGEIYIDCNGNESSWGVTTDFEERWVYECETSNAWHFYIQCGSFVGSMNTCYC